MTLFPGEEGGGRDHAKASGGILSTLKAVDLM